MLAFDPTTKAAVSAAKLAASNGGIVDACTSAVVSSIGANYFVRVRDATTVYLSLAFTGSLPKQGKRISIPISHTTLATLTSVSRTKSGLYVLVTNNAETRYIRGTVGASGTDFILSGDLSTSSGVGMGASVDLYFDPALDQVTTIPITGSIRLALPGDSIWNGSGVVAGQPEGDYVSPRGGTYRNLTAAGITVNAIGIAARANPVRGGGPTACAAQGGARLTTTTAVDSISTLLDKLLADNPAGPYNDLVLVLEGGTNDAFAGATGTQIAGYWQTIVTKAQSLFPGAYLVCVGVFPSLSVDVSYSAPTAALLSSLDTGTGKVIHLDLRAAANWVTADFVDGTHLTDVGAAKASTLITNKILARVVSQTTTTPPSTALNELIQQQSAHEVFPFVADPTQTYTLHPYEIYNEPGLSLPFSLKGSSLMPSWFNPSNKASLAAQYFVDIGPWFVVCNIRNSSGQNANTSSTTGVKGYQLETMIWRGANNYDAPIAGGVDWAGLYRNDFTTYLGDSNYKRNSDGSVLALPTTDGLGAVHGGGAFANNISSPETVQGVLFRMRVVLARYSDGVIVTDANARRAIYVGADAFPRGGNANTTFQGYNFAPGLGAGAFIEVKSTPRWVTWTSMTPEQLRAFPPPGY